MSHSSNNNNNNQGARTISSDDHSPTPITSKKNNDFNINNMKGLAIVYKECLKNHAASLGGNAKDGCGEFMATGGDNLDCSACGCHRNFHRREVDVGGGVNGYLPHSPFYWGTKPSVTITQCHQSNYKGVGLTAKCGPHDLVIPSVGPVITCHKEGNGEDGKMKIERAVEINKKRHRTRFTSEQKEKMLGFAEKSEWKIQKLEEGLVQQFCQEIGIKRRVLKVWMHNNKQHYVHKDGNTATSTSINHTSES